MKNIAGSKTKPIIGMWMAECMTLLLQVVKYSPSWMNGMNNEAKLSSKQNDEDAYASQATSVPFYAHCYTNVFRFLRRSIIYSITYHCYNFTTLAFSAWMSCGGFCSRNYSEHMSIFIFL